MSTICVRSATVRITKQREAGDLGVNCLFVSESGCSLHAVVFLLLIYMPLIINVTIDCVFGKRISNRFQRGFIYFVIIKGFYIFT